MPIPTNHENHLQAIRQCVALLSMVVLAGTLGFFLTEEWTLWRCLYFTLITISTVGYGDLGVSPLGEVVAALLLVCGIGTFTFSLSTLVQIATDEEGKRQRKMKREIDECSDHIIVCGYGRMGETICDQVRRAGMTVVVIERDDHNYIRSIDDGYLTLQGQASEDETLLAAGVMKARGIVCAVSSDAENMFICVSARDLNPECLVVARAESFNSGRKLKHAGATISISPQQMAGVSAANALLRPCLTNIMSGDDLSGRFELGEAVVNAKSSLVGKSIDEFGHEAEGAVFIAIRRASGELVVRPRGRDRFATDDVIIFAGSDDDAVQVQTAAGGDLSA